MTETTIILDSTAVHLADELTIDALPIEPEFWHDRERFELTTGRILSVFDYRATWNYQELHPDGEEFVVLLEGDADLLLDAGAGEATVRLTPGTACIIPRMVWHRAAIRQPSTLLFITPTPAATQQRAV